MQKNLLQLTIIFGILLILPVAVLANCQWFPDATCGGDTAWTNKGVQDNFCLPQLKQAGYGTCCCGPSGDTVGCCLCSVYDGSNGLTKYFGTYTSANACSKTKGSSSTGPQPCQFKQGLFPQPYYYMSQDQGAACGADQGHCSWYVNNNCSDIGLLVAPDPTWCRSDEKPNFDSAKCCCGRNVNPVQTAPTSTLPTANKFSYSGMTNPLQTVDVVVVINRVVRAVLLIIGTVFLAIIIYGGFLWMTAGGNASKVTKGRNTLIWGVLGIVVIFLAWILVGFIFQTAGA